MLAQQEQVFVNSVTQTIEAQAQAIAQLEDLNAVYFDRGYHDGGANEIDDTDLENEHINAAGLGDAMNLAAQLIALRDNQAVFQADWGATINKVRKLS